MVDITLKVSKLISKFDPMLLLIFKIILTYIFLFRLDLDYYKDGTVDYLVSYLVSICNVVVVVIIISLLRMGFLEVIGIIGCSTVQH